MFKQSWIQQQRNPALVKSLNSPKTGDLHTAHTPWQHFCMCAGECARPIPPHVRSILFCKASRAGRVMITLQSCFRAGIKGRLLPLEVWQSSNWRQFPLARNRTLKLVEKSNKSWVDVCKVKITVRLLGDELVDVNLRVVEDRSASLQQLCYASLPPLPFWAWRKLFTRCPAVQPRAGPGRLFSITQIKSTLSIQSHNSPHTSSRETAAQRGTWSALSFPWVKVAQALKDRVTSVSALLPVPQVSGPSLVSLYHTLLITAMTGPLSQRMPSSFCWSHMFTESCLKAPCLDPGQGVWLAGLFDWELQRLSCCLLRKLRRISLSVVLRSPGCENFF